MKKLLVAMLLGAGLAYFLDPDNGVRRRTTWQNRLNRTSTPQAVTTVTTPLATTTNG